MQTVSVTPDMADSLDFHGIGVQYDPECAKKPYEVIVSRLHSWELLVVRRTKPSGDEYVTLINTKDAVTGASELEDIRQKAKAEQATIRLYRFTVDTWKALTKPQQPRPLALIEHGRCFGY